MGKLILEGEIGIGTGYENAGRIEIGRLAVDKWGDGELVECTTLGKAMLAKWVPSPIHGFQEEFLEGKYRITVEKLED